MTVNIAVVGGGMAGLELATHIGGSPRIHVEVFERGPSVRREHIEWDTSVYSGDGKIRRWSSRNWGAGGGLSERLGGRSLCYHGVCLGIEPQALADWPSAWVGRLTGDDGAYQKVCDDLKQQFPELRPRRLSEPATHLGLKHVPQAAFFDAASRRFKAYSPLPAAVRMAETGGPLRITRGAVQRLIRTRSGWSIDLLDQQGDRYTRGGFDCCVLAASAISNVTLLGETLQQELRTRITDHFCAGALARLPPGNELDTFRHRKLWSGYIPAPSLATNVFIQEMMPTPSGDRLVEVFAVFEQGETQTDYGDLSVTPGHGGRSPRTYIEGKVSANDQDRLHRVGRHVLETVNSIANGPVEDISERDLEPEPPPYQRDVFRGREDARWLAYDQALDALVRQRTSGKVTRFDFPYGSFEHEACTHPIGSSPSLTVTEDLEVDGLPNVYVAGPGAFVRPGAANPALTILAMSRLLGSTLKERYL
jgi:hypothetical protein